MLSSFTAPLRAAEADEFSVPPYSGVYQPQGSDEQGIWAIADEDERKLRDSNAVINDPALNAYVRSVLCRTVGEERCGNVRLYIVRVPYFNASMAPNGTLRVYTGALLRLRSEAELASLLGHEFAHFELRHTLAAYRARRNGTDLLAWTAVLGAAATTWGSGTSVSTRDTQLAILGGLSAFNRSQENQADLLGFGYIAQVGYRPSAAADVWRSIMNESDRGAETRGRRSHRYDSVAFFASHPTELERADRLAVLANRAGTGEFEGVAQYRAAMAAWMPQFLSDQLALNDFGGTDYLISRLSGDEASAELLFARGELYRTRGNPRDLVDAGEFFRQALSLDPQRVEAWRGLGLALLRSGATAEGAEALRTYLTARPDAPDAAMLQTLVQD